MALVVTNQVDHHNVIYKKGDVLPDNLVSDVEVEQQKLTDGDVKRMNDERKAALLKIGAVVEADNAKEAVHPEPTQESLQASPQPEKLKAQAGQPLKNKVEEDDEDDDVV